MITSPTTIMSQFTAKIVNLDGSTQRLTNFIKEIKHRQQKDIDTKDDSNNYSDYVKVNKNIKMYSIIHQVQRFLS
ncbi:7100_t:CDS:2 [Rhizophagus irregularis]|nr:7100_t:CDS:2 [Rhizophagus irregularis]